MVRIRDAVWLLVLAALGSLWYADRSVLADSLSVNRAALARETARAELMHEKLRVESLKNRVNGRQ
jgi:hypothetical protein